MKRLPGPLQTVVDRLSSLPGIGPKSALRIALHLLKTPRAEAENVGLSIIDLRENLCMCEECASLAESSPCALCSDPERDRGTLCLVSEWDSLLALEEMGQFNGRYLVLGGLIDPLSGVDPHDLEFDRLKRHLSTGEISEMILALGATMEAEATASYVINLVERQFPGVSVTRLAQGIPMGGEVKYMDKETLRQSLMHRQKL